MYIPNAPHIIDVAAPTQNANDVYIPANLSTQMNIKTANIRTTTAQIEYYALMNSAAP